MILDPLSSINGLVFGALLFLGFSVCALVWAAMTLIPQVNRTLSAYEKLAVTLEEELGPTLQEVQKVVVGVGELKQIAGQTMGTVSHKVEDVSGTLTKVAGSATKQSSVWAHGLFAGVKTYLEGKHESREHS